MRVIRGSVGKNNDIEYETQISHEGGLPPLRSDHTYSDFKELNDKLLAAFVKDKTYYAASVSSEFPRNHSSLLGLSETQLSERSRMLDTWFRDLCSSYRSLRDAERQLVRSFLVFDMTNPADIAVQDKLAQGFVEANRSTVTGELGAATVALKAAKPDEFETKSEGGKRRASMLAFANPNDTQSENGAIDPRVQVVQSSQLSNKLNTDPRLPNRAIRRASSYDPTHSGTMMNIANSGPTPLMRAHSNGDSPAGYSPPSANPAAAKRRTSYVVSVPNADAPKWNPVAKDLPPIDDNSMASHESSSRHGGIERPMLLSDAKSSTDKGDNYSDDQRESGLEEKLLRIGMSDNKKKSTGCCTIM